MKHRSRSERTTLKPRPTLLRSLLSSPLALAVVVTVANAAKPVAVDDTAYLLFARHIAHSPTDPYRFSLFWWSAPEPAMGILCPPVVPYWLAAGVGLFGESPALLKLWLFPFLWLLAWALRALLVRFARGTESFALPLLMLSPAVLPAVNLMLDVPAVALALAAVEVFARGGARRAILAGALAALAIQAKYSAFVAPAVIAWYGLAHRKLVPAVIACAVCAALFVGWELLMAQRYGESHFWRHATATAGASSTRERLIEKFDLIAPLTGYLGGLAVGGGLLALSALRVPRRWLVGVGSLWCVGVVLIAAVPKRWTVLTPDATAGSAFWQAAGALWLGAAVACAGVLLFRVSKGLGVRPRADSWFLVGWLVIEVSAALALTPFPAARRVIGAALVLGLVAARASGHVSRARPERRPPQWVLALGVGAGIAVAALDTFDAYPEKACAERAAEFVRDRPPGARVWFVGHWGFQYYCDRAGFEPLVPGQTAARAGDLVLIPVYPADGGFYRPYAGFEVREPVWRGDVVAELWWNDWLSAQTLPNFYGGMDPVAGRDHARLRVRVWKLRGEWRP